VTAEGLASRTAGIQAAIDDGEVEMTAAQLRKRLDDRFLGEIEELKFPSASMLNRVESTLRDRDALAGYAELLVEKVEATQFPSVSMLKRIDGVLARLEQQERAERAAEREDEED
jgi:hypothetical protein